MKSPGLLLADEPTGNLDDDMAEEILELISDIWQRGTTVFLATHQARPRRASSSAARSRSSGGRLVKDEG